MEVVGYLNGIEGKVLQLWSKLQPNDAVSQDVFIRKVLLDPNFEREGFLVATEGSEVKGYLQCFVRKYPFLYAGKENEKGWISALVATKEVAQALLESAQKYFRSKGCKEIWFSNYTPNYFLPGVDAELYPELYRTLVDAGFNTEFEAIAMDAQLWPRLTYPENVSKIERSLLKKGISVHDLKMEEIVSLLEFIRDEFSADWYCMCAQLLERGAPLDSIVVATKDNRVIGYCQYWGNDTYHWHVQGSHFGPFGVKSEFRGRGIGTLVLKHCLENMKKRGIHNAFFLWTDEKAARLYEKFGFKVTRRFKVMKKVL